MSQRRKRTRDRRMVAGSHRLAATSDAALTAPTERRVPSSNGVGSRAATVRYPRAERPLTELQAVAYGALSDVPAHPKALSERCSLSAKQAQDAVYALSGKGLAVRTRDGWVKA